MTDMPPPRFRTLLFDLDGTLLGIDMEAFQEAMIQRLVQQLGSELPAEVLVPAFVQATDTTRRQHGSEQSNGEVWRKAFLSALNPAVGSADMGDQLDRAMIHFFLCEYPKLRELAHPFPGVPSLLQDLHQQGYELVVATDPLFPAVAVRERLWWAGVAEIPFRLVTTIEQMHATKPHPAYYTEILTLLERRPHECMMIGNNAAMDMAAGRLGLETYLVENDYTIATHGDPQPDARGSLEQLRGLLLD